MNNPTDLTPVIRTQRVHLKRGVVTIAWRGGDAANWWYVK